MKVLILSRKKRLYSTRRLREEVEKLGHDVLVLDPLKCVLSLKDDGPRMFYGPKEIRSVDLVFPRVGTFGTAYAISVVRHLGLMRVPAMNDDGAITRARNKLECLQILAGNGIRIPDTLISRHPRMVRNRLRHLGGTPVIMKLLRGTWGTGVIYAESEAAVESMLETMWGIGEDIMIQKFIAESMGKDIRALVVDGKVVASMRRVAKPGEFRSNIHRGGTGERVDLPKEYEEAALASARVTGLLVAGVDMLESSEGPKVIEVNASPGFQGMEKATGQNVARMIVEAGVAFASRVKGNS
jgi:ribosomal protein S6--L-glutamate ligase